MDRLSGMRRGSGPVRILVAGMGTGSGPVRILVAGGLLACLLGAGTARGQNIPREEVDRQISLSAFKAFAAKLFPEATPEIRVAEIPCGERLCLRFEAADMPRDVAARCLPQLAGGFGFGGHVVGLSLRTSRDRPLIASVAAVVDIRKRDDEVTLSRRAARILVLFRMLSPVAPRSAVARPETFTSQQPVYLLGQVETSNSGTNLVAVLYAPPGSAKPRLRLPDDTCREPVVSAESDHASGAFAGWKRFRVQLTCP